MEFHHIPIMAGECMDALAPARGGIYVDCTAGGGGHSFEIASRLPSDGVSRLISLDRDDEAIAAQCISAGDIHRYIGELLFTGQVGILGDQACPKGNGDEQRQELGTPVFKQE